MTLRETPGSQVMSADLFDAYREMASDVPREAEAAEWAEATISDAVAGPRLNWPMSPSDR